MPDDLLPWSQEAEEAVVGSLLIDPSLTALLATIVHPSDFHDERLAEVYRICLKLGSGLDYVTVTEALKRPEWNSAVAGLITTVPTAIHAEHYAAIVHRDGVRRRAIKAASEIAAHAYSSSDANDVVARAHTLVQALVEGRPASDLSLPSLTAPFYDTVEKWYAHPLQPGECRYLSTGFAAIDELCDGLEPRTLTVVCGRPSAGKSALAMEIARRVGTTGHNVLIFSLEMSVPQILQRWASAMSGVAMRDAQRGIGDSTAYVNAVLNLSNLRNIWIDDTPALTPSQVRARALARHLQDPLSLIVLDHGGEMMSDGGSRNENEATEEGRKTKAMKDLAKEIGCPFLLVLQLNRAVEGRANKRPAMADLRASGVHEQAADLILGLYRESYYDPECENPNLMEVGILKNRQGVAGGIPITLWYEREYQRFKDADVARKRIDIL